MTDNKCYRCNILPGEYYECCCKSKYCYNCYDPSISYINLNEWICCINQCTLCNQLCCENCAYVCFDCYNSTEDSKTVYCAKCVDSYLVFTGCKNHIWYCCNKEYHNDKKTGNCGQCFVNKY